MALCEECTNDKGEVMQKNVFMSQHHYKNKALTLKNYLNFVQTVNSQK